jgi:hypothetical protein
MKLACYVRKDQKMQGGDSMAAEAASGIFALIGAVVGAGLKAGSSRTQSQRRANGKVVAQVQKARLIVEEINSAFYNENKETKELIQQVQKKLEEEGQPKEKWPQFKSIYEENDLSKYEKTDDFITSQRRVWDTINKAEEVVADNLLELSDRFAKEYWKFYRRLLIPNPDAIPKAKRYRDAENVFLEYEPKLTRLARGERLSWLMYMGAALVAGIALGAFGAAHWQEFSPHWLKDLFNTQ